MRKQATRNCDLIQVQQKRQRLHERLLALVVVPAFIGIVAYAVVGLITPDATYDHPKQEQQRATP